MTDKYQCCLRSLYLIIYLIRFYDIIICFISNNKKMYLLALVRNVHKVEKTKKKK